MAIRESQVGTAIMPVRRKVQPQMARRWIKSECPVLNGLFIFINENKNHRSGIPKLGEFFDRVVPDAVESCAAVQMDVHGVAAGAEQA